MISLSTGKKLHPRIDFVTFGDGSPAFRASSKRLARNAKHSGWFVRSKSYNFSYVKREFQQVAPSGFEKNRGFGFWLWKPIMLRKFALQNVDTDLILYADAGCHLNVNSVSQQRFKDYVNAITVSNPLMVFQSTNIERQWTKEDLLQKFDESDKDTGQFLATILLAKRDFLINLCEDWIDLACLEDFHFLDDSNSEHPSYQGFVEHRHDQSILSYLLKKQKIIGFPESETYQIDWSYLTDFPIWSTRYISGADFKSKDMLNSFRRKKDAMAMKFTNFS